MTYDEVMKMYTDAPVGKSIDPVTRALNGTDVFLPVQKTPALESGKLKEDLKLKTTLDNLGRPWACIYTNIAEFSAAFPEGGPFVEMAFTDVFKMISSDENFGGIWINSDSELMFYPIPRELFEDVAKILAE